MEKEVQLNLFRHQWGLRIFSFYSCQEEKEKYSKICWILCLYIDSCEELPSSRLNKQTKQCYFPEDKTHYVAKHTEGVKWTEIVGFCNQSYET